MTAPTDLAAFRLLRALREGGAGSFEQLWNAHAGAVWSVVRLLAPDAAEAEGWCTTFRIELAERATGFDGAAAVGEQVGLALHRHLLPGFSGRGPLPARITPDEAGLRSLPEVARLELLVGAFFEVPIEAFEDGSDAEARARRAAVEELLPAALRSSAPDVAPEDAPALLRAALSRPPPPDVLILAPGLAPGPPQGRWWLLGVLLAVVFLVLAGPSLRALVQRPDLAALAARHAETLQDLPIRAEAPLELALALTRAGVPSVLVDAPALGAADLELEGARFVEGPVPAVVLRYRAQDGEWTLQHFEGEPALDGEVVDARETEEGRLEARRAPGADLTLVAWREGSTSWVLGADAPPGVVLARALVIREVRATPAIPFLGDGAPMPEEGHSE